MERKSAGDLSGNTAPANRILTEIKSERTRATSGTQYTLTRIVVLGNTMKTGVRAHNKSTVTAQ